MLACCSTRHNPCLAVDLRADSTSSLHFSESALHTAETLEDGLITVCVPYAAAQMNRRSIYLRNTAAAGGFGLQYTNV
jgi:hypothetical protein